MGRWCAERTTAEALEILAKAKIPAGPVLKPQQTLDDPHIQAMGFFQPTEFPGAPKPAPLAKVPVWLSGTPGSIRRRAAHARRAHRPDPGRARLHEEGHRRAAREGRGLGSLPARPYPRPSWNSMDLQHKFMRFGLASWVLKPP